MNESIMKKFVRKCEDDFIRFMGIESMPPFQIEPKETSLELGFGSPAEASYDIPTGTHKLIIWSTIPELHADYIVFHELTHVLDAETYSKRDKLRHFSNRGYTEYHAAQIDFMKLLGVENISQSFSFSMNHTLETISGTITAVDFVERPHELATELINRQDFPANMETLVITIGAIFNYYGRRSICKMYARDYLERVDKSSITKLIQKDMVTLLDEYMLEWFDKKLVANIDQLYYQMAISLYQQYNLP